MSYCLDLAKQTYANILKTSEIEQFYNEILKQKAMVEKSSANIAQELSEYAAMSVNDRAIELKARQLQNLKTLEAVMNNIQNIKTWMNKGIKNPILKYIKAKIGGSAIRIEGARASTELKMARAYAEEARKFINDLHDAKVLTIWNDVKFEVQIADALFKVRRNLAHEIKDENFKNIAEIVAKHYDKLNDLRRENGIIIHELDDRIAPNIHDVSKIRTMTIGEILEARRQGKTRYQYQRDRWIDFTLKNLDLYRTFTQSKVDFENPTAVRDFMNHVYDSIVNDKSEIEGASGRGVGLARRLSQPRILHWKDAESLIAQNKRFGSGAIQDSIANELTNGFARLELIKDWGVNPIDTLRSTVRLMEKDPEMFERYEKGKDIKTAKRLLQALMMPTTGYQGKLGQIFRNLRAFQTISKLGMVMIRSMSDLGLLGEEAANHNVPAYNAVSEALTKLVGGSKHEKELFKDLWDTAAQTQIGSVAKYAVEGLDASSTASTIMRASFKWSGLEQWDKSMRETILSIVSRSMAILSKTPWEKLNENNRDIFSLYNIGEKDWKLISKAETKVFGNKSYITPDAISDLSDEDVMDVLGGSPSPMRIKQYREAVKNKVQDYYQDRMEHVILRPGVLDMHFITFGFGPTQNHTANQVIKMITQFKLYSVALTRGPLASKLYGKGAVNFKEALLGGKANYWGLTKFAAVVAGWKFASMCLDNFVQGLTPPSLDKVDTWEKLLTEPLGILGLVAEIDPKDIRSSLGQIISGPAMGDINKLGQLGYNVVNETAQGGNYDKTKNSFSKLLVGSIPKYPWLILALRYLLGFDIEEFANPGARQRYLNLLQQKTGAEPI